MFLPDGSACLLAYGQFTATTLSGMWAQLIPHLVRGIWPVLTLYAVASFVAELPRCRILGVALYILGVLLLSQTFMVMGAFGPAHIALHTTMRLTVLLLPCIVAKAVLTSARPDSAAATGVCTRCGYDISRCADGRCSECGCGFRVNIAKHSVKPDA